MPANLDDDRNAWDDDPDAPQEIDLNEDEDEDSGYLDCPSCGKTIDEDAPCCPYCGQWVIAESGAARRSSGWFWPLMVGLLVAVILVLWHGLGR